MFKNRRNIWIFLGALVMVVVAVGLILFSGRSQGTAAAAYQTTTVQLGTLTSSVEGSGTVASALSASLAWQTSGQVDKVSAQVGAQVKNGDVLATLLQTSSTVNSLQTALVNAQENLAELTSPAAVAAAQAAVASDESALTNAQYNLANLNYHRQGAIESAKAALVLAQYNLTITQRVVDSLANKPLTDPNKALFTQTLYAYQVDYDKALYLYDSLTQPASPAATDAAKAAVALAQANLAQDQDYLAALSGGTVPANATGTPLLNLQQAQLAVQTAQQNLASVTIVAPFDGTITQANAEPGQVVANGTAAFRIDNFSNLVVTIQVVQIDVNSIKVGQPAKVTFIAIPNKTYTGKVIKVDMAGTSTSNSVNFKVGVQLIDADARVKPGMSANVTITTNQVANALLVPNTAIFTDTNGKDYVYLVQNGTPTAVPVTVGAISDTSSQITGNSLKQGDAIVLSFPSAPVSSVLPVATP